MQTLTAKEFKANKDRGEELTLLNTLSSEAFPKTHLPQAINVPLESPDFAQRVERESGGKDRPVVVYCANQECDSSRKAAQVLEHAGFTDVYDFEGRAKTWEEAGEKLEVG